MRYPPAPRLDLVEVLHGRHVADPYRWLEDPRVGHGARAVSRTDSLSVDTLSLLAAHTALEL